MIEPTIGRIVLYVARDAEPDTDERNAAIVAHVNDDGTVNLGIFSEYGVASAVQNVKLVQDDAVPAPNQAEWMPYQKGQSAKYDSTTDDLLARVQRMEDVLTGPTAELELPPLALKTPAELPMDNIAPFKGDDFDPVNYEKEAYDSGPGDDLEDKGESADAEALADNESVKVAV